ncbi:MAG: chloride channel protein [Oscillospiraceae bacterium]|nr:chloride channel protein [Oscillospiraceae bacterium]
MNHIKQRHFAGILSCIGYGLLCGAVTGAVIFLFKLAAKQAEHLSRQLYGLARLSPLFILLIFALLFAFGAAMVYLHKKVPEAKGGGIPRSEGVLRGILTFRWLPTLLATVGGSLLSYLGGLPLGTEGPAVLIGTSLGKMCSGKAGARSRYVMTGGAGAGFAVATGAPLSGILFAMEEIHKRVTPLLLLTVSVSVLSATYLNRLLCSAFSLSPNMLHLPSLSGFEMNHVGWLLGMGILTALAVALFDRSIALVRAFAQKHQKHLTPKVKIFAVFALTGILGLFLADGIYSGHDVILEAVENHFGLGLLFLLFAVRLVMMLMVTDSGTTGGIFIPTLAIGALAGAIIAKLFVMCGMEPQLYASVVLLSMCAFIGGTLRAPLTAAVLFVELTGQFVDVFYGAVVIFTVNCITELLNQEPFYDIALGRMVHTQNEGRTPVICHFEAKVSPNAFAVGKPARNLMWPACTIILSITRAESDLEDMDRDGEKTLRAGDRLVIRARCYDVAEVKQQLTDLLGKDSPIREISE